MTDENIRFGGVERLYGKSNFKKIQKAHVCIIGVGGVGSWAVEALARSGIGHLTLIDYDEVCVSNTNRQLQAMEGHIGRMKIDVLKERLLKINPDIKVNTIAERIDVQTAESLIQVHFDVVVDAIDRVGHKIAILLECQKKKIPVIISGGAAGRKDPSQIALADLRDVHGDRLLFQMRRRLRTNHRFPKPPNKMKVTCIFSSEHVTEAQLKDDDSSCEIVSVGDFSDGVSLGSKPLDCGQGLGTASFITGTFGFLAASYCINTVLKKSL